MAKTSTKKKVAANYQLSVRLGDEILKSAGDTALEALQLLQRPRKITTKMFVTLQNGDRRAEQMLMPLKAKRFFYRVAQPYIARNLEFILK